MVALAYILDFSNMVGLQVQRQIVVSIYTVFYCEFL
jgi:hypothetical protein